MASLLLIIAVILLGLRLLGLVTLTTLDGSIHVALVITAILMIGTVRRTRH